jgi:hypothetical protein
VANSSKGEGLPVVINISTGFYSLSSTPFVFDNLTLASEIRLVGAAGTTLQADLSSGPLFKVSTGAPKVTMQGLELRSQVVVDGGKLHLESSSFMNVGHAEHGRRLDEESSTAEGGALHVSSGGELTAENTIFEGCNATRGGAVYISDGAATFRGCNFTDCRADDRGGAIYVNEGGTLLLANKTQISCPSYGVCVPLKEKGGSIYSKVSWEYELPALLAHYVPPSPPVGIAYVDKNYPYECSATLYGNTENVADQNGPQCSDTWSAPAPPTLAEQPLCGLSSLPLRPCGGSPAGSFCSVATINPYPCKAGTYCPFGSPAEIPCPAGRYNPEEQMRLEENCITCGPGTHCPEKSKHPTACAIGTYNNVSEQEECKDCPVGTFQAHTNQTACELCPTGKYNDQPGAGSCTDCPAGFWSDKEGLKSSDE